MIFKYEDIKDKESELAAKIKCPWVRVLISTLGGRERPSLIIKVSLDAADTWVNGIWMNSRFYIFNIDYDGTVENYTCSHKLKKIRKKKVKSLDAGIKYINDKLSKYERVFV